MKRRERFSPFTGGTGPRGGLLKNSPLALVLCQVRWPELTVFRQNYAKFAEAVGERLHDFPVRAVSKQYTMNFGPEGASEPEPWLVYQWSTMDQTGTVTLSAESISVAQTDYSGGYKAFESALKTVLLALQEAAEIPLYDRVGIRYVNRLTEKNHLENLDDLIKPEARGLEAMSVSPTAAQKLETMTAGLYEFEGGKLQVRMGTLPVGQTPDALIPPLDEKAWVLDFDSFVEGRQVFDVESIIKQISHLSDAARDFLGYIATPEFVEVFGERAT